MAVVLYNRRKGGERKLGLAVVREVLVLGLPQDY